MCGVSGNEKLSQKRKKIVNISSGIAHTHFLNGANFSQSQAKIF